MTLKDSIRVHKQFKDEEEECKALGGMNRMNIATWNETEVPLIAFTEYIIIKKEEAVGNIGNIYVPGETAKKSRPTRGKVLCIGLEATIPLLNIGDIVVYHEYAETIFTVEGKEYVAVKRKDIICKVVIKT